MNIYPEQKSKKDKEFYIANAKYWKGLANFGDNSYNELRQLARVADGELIDEDYEAVLNPYGVEDETLLTSRPATLKNINIIKPVINARLGERTASPFNLLCIALNSDEDNTFNKELNKKIIAAMTQDAVNFLNAAGLNTGVESKEVPSYEEIAKQHSESFKDKRAIFGQDALDYIKFDQDLEDKYMDLYNDWLYFGRAFTYKNTSFGNVTLQRVDPFNIWYYKTQTSKYLEDSPAVVVRYAFAINEIKDRFRHLLEKEDLQYLEEKAKNVSDYFGTAFQYIDQTENIKNYDTYNIAEKQNGNIWIYHIVWQSQTKIGYLKYIDNLGQMQERDVDENYEFNPEAGDIEIEWDWISEWHEVLEFDDKVYFGYGAGAEQRNDINNLSLNKLCYNGLVKTSKLGAVASLVKEGLVYQCLVNIYHYNREKVINKSRDKILMLPIGLIPAEFGKNGVDPIDKFMSFLDNHSVMPIDDTKPNFASVINGLKQLDLSLGSFVESLTNVINSIKQEYWDAIGFNRQRFGETYASDGKGVNEQALFRSSLISAEDDRQFNKLVEKDANGLLDYARYAWVNGKKAHYLNSDMEQKILDIEQEEDLIKFMSSNFGVFAVKSREEAEKLKLLKDYAFGLAQKGGVGEDVVAEIIDSNNFAKIKKYIKDAKVATQEYEMQKQKQITDSQEKIQQMINDNAQADRDSKEKIAEDYNDTIINGKLIDADATVLGYDKGMNGAEDAQKIEEMQFEREKFNKTHNLKERELSQKTQQDKTKNFLELMKTKSQEKIARQNKKK
jgi:hypothetical protein